MNLDKNELNTNLETLIEKGFINSTKCNKDIFYHYS